MHQAGFSIHPRAEVFNANSVIPPCKKNNIPSFTDYFIRLVSRWSDNQQVGFKISARQLFWLTKTGLLTHFRKVKIINSIRQDTLSQAVSLCIARHTGQWHSKMKMNEDTGPIPYSRNDILRCLHFIHSGQELTNYYTTMHNVPSITVEYENTLANPDREIQRLANFMECLRVTDIRVDLGAVNIKQQRNEENERLLQLFKEEFFLT